MREYLLLYLNGQRHEIHDGWATATLSDWLREHQRMVGTKVVCAEGDCGACSVLVGKLDASGKLVYRAIDSCIAFLFQLDCCHVVSVEGLKLNGTLSPVQQAMVDCHGSQCGFCTPGFVTTMHGMLEPNGDDTKHPLTEEGLRYGLSGNLCRCTGYRQIIDAGLAIDPAKVARISELYDETKMLQEFTKLGGDHLSILNESADQNFRVLLPRTLEQAAEFKNDFPRARLVTGATDVGVQRNHGRIQLDQVISLAGVRDFDQIKIDEDELIIGAGATWRQVENAVETVLPEFWAILTRFGSPQIRNFATIGGNLANASPIADCLPLLYATDAEIQLTSTHGNRLVRAGDFYLGYKQLDMQPDELISAVRLPLPKEDEALKLYKVSKRRDMDISTVTAAIWLKLVGEQIEAARIALGGVGPVVLRCPKAEQSLIGQPFSAAAMRKAGQLARTEISPISDVRSGAPYRLLLAENLVARTWADLSPDALTTPAGAS